MTTKVLNLQNWTLFISTKWLQNIPKTLNIRVWCVVCVCKLVLHFGWYQNHRNRSEREMTILYHTQLHRYEFAKTITGNWGYCESDHFTQHITLVYWRYIIFPCWLTDSLTMFVGNRHVDHIYI